MFPGVGVSGSEPVRLLRPGHPLPGGGTPPDTGTPSLPQRPFIIHHSGSAAHVTTRIPQLFETDIDSKDYWFQTHFTDAEIWAYVYDQNIAVLGERENRTLRIQPI